MNVIRTAGNPGSDIQRFGLLRRVRMRSTGIALELLDHCVAQRPFGQHSLDRFLQGASGETRLHLLEIRRVDATGITAVPVVELRFRLVSGAAQLLDVRYDDE